ncbi:MAG: hypothetical protein AAB801_03165 [Patescibacteria group bacterium]
MTDIERLGRENIEAARDGITRDERVRRRIQEAIGYGSPLIDPKDAFVVMGIDGMDYSMFPCGSTQDIESARELARQKIDEEPQYSSGPDIATSFHIFTMGGALVPLEDRSAK